jgi:rod shape-determining protein MreD
VTSSMRPSSAQSVSRQRYATFVVFCLLAAMVLEDPLVIGGARPDFVLVALTYGALMWHAQTGALLGFGLGLFRDALVLSHFGLHALGMTVLGYGLGKSRETLYLTTPGVDLTLLAGGKLVLDVLILGAAASGSWEAFETRFFWEGPLSAAYTALVGGLCKRLLLGR